MPKGTYKRKPITEEHRKNLSLSHKGQKAWNKGISNETTKRTAKIAQNALRGKPAWNRDIKMPQITGKNHPKYKDNILYGSLHDWVYYHKGKPEICQACGSEYKLQWASIDSKYLRDIEEWISLCAKCHYHYDDLGNKRWKNQKKE